MASLTQFFTFSWQKISSTRRSLWEITDNRQLSALLLRQRINSPVPLGFRCTCWAFKLISRARAELQPVKNLFKSIEQLKHSFNRFRTVHDTTISLVLSSKQQSIVNEISDNRKHFYFIIQLQRELKSWGNICFSTSQCDYLPTKWMKKQHIFDWSAWATTT